MHLFPSPFPRWVGFATAAAWETDRIGVHAEEMAVLSPRAVDSRRLSFALGRVAARRAREALGFATTPLLRYPDGSPRWPIGVVGSITHTADRAAAAAAASHLTAGIGLDLEDLRCLGSESIARLVADPGEQQWIANDPGRLISVFSAKEAIFKAFYPSHGEFFGFDAVRLEADPTGFTATLLVKLADWPAGSKCHVLSQHYGSLVLSSVLLPESKSDSPG